MTRFLVGIMVGAALVIGGAYVHDTGMMRRQAAGAAPVHPLVN